MVRFPGILFARVSLKVSLVVVYVAVYDLVGY